MSKYLFMIEQEKIENLLNEGYNLKEANEIVHGQTIRLEVKLYAEAMEKELKENDYKGGWKDCDIGFLVEKLHEEVGELLGCMKESAAILKDTPAKKYYEDYPERLNKFKKLILSEAADVGNMAMMLADICKAL